MKVEDLYRDAMRYVELRSIAIEQGDLQVVVAISRLDYCPNEAVFDATVDGIIAARKAKGKTL